METEGLRITAQDKSLPTRNYPANSKKKESNAICRLCEQKTEPTDHLVSGCSIVSPIEYKDKHDKMRQYIYWKIYKYYGIPKSEKWYKRQPEQITEVKGSYYSQGLCYANW